MSACCSSRRQHTASCKRANPYENIARELLAQHVHLVYPVIYVCVFTTSFFALIFPPSFLVGGSVRPSVRACVLGFAPGCLHPHVFIGEGRPAGTVVVGEGEEPPDGRPWQRGQL